MAQSDWLKYGITTAVAVAAFLVGLVEFGQTYALSVQQPFLTEQLKQCMAATEHAARLASTLNPDTWKKSREEFWMLYLGPLAIVEDVGSENLKKSVAQIMVEIGNELEKVQTPPSSLPFRQVHPLALDLSYACRDLMITRWNAGLLSWLQKPPNLAATRWR